ncbi:ABC transporter substrate-binding protein [Paenibacillus sp. V4I7]|uniref:ABC transporter substrate-binding protein n=1 Tax=Paenibacillus sp. V4I7 TaxID=3042307 RepID=UPI00277D77E1|nr:ABC transporter substrate-binding protein [Paenibacillus sp. V4I7]MDQ0901077.1 multiple sugar transport system substrate-binding protein [Paenibacillus sp. V4I7]
MKRSGGITIILLLVMALSGCDEIMPKSEEYAQPAAKATEAKKSIRIIATIDEQTPITQSFRQAHPDQNVEWVKTKGEDLSYALAGETSPDLVIVDNVWIRQLNDLDLFEDLSQDPYRAESRITDEWFPKLDLTSYKSLDGTKLIAIPKDLPVEFTFYRADILEKYGFPPEPKALGDYLEDPAHWVHMAKVLKQHSHWIFSYATDPTYMVSGGLGYLGRNKENPRNDARMVNALNTAKAIQAEGLVRNLNIWDDNGKNAIRNGELVMLYWGEWGKYLLKEWSPETSGQWKMTRLPLGSYVTRGGAAILMHKKSENKPEAWDYIQHSMTQEAPYRDSLEGKLWYDRLPGIWVTPLDRRAEEIWNAEIPNKLQDLNSPSIIQLNEIDAKLRSELNKELMILHEAISP